MLQPLPADQNPASPPGVQPAASFPEDRPYYGIAEAARLLGINRVTLWRWISAGRVAVWRVGPRTARIRREDLQRLLVRAGRNGHSVHPQAAATSSGQAVRPGQHFVHFYESDDFIADTVADFLGAGLSAGEAAVVIAAEPHRRAIDARLRATGLDLDDAAIAGRFVLLDAAATLARFMVDDAPDPDRFAAVIGGVLAGASAGGRRPVRALGEMVALLVQEGNPSAALQLERLWNDLQQSHSFSLMCAYPMDQLAGADLTELVGEICAIHSHVEPAESYAALTLEEDRSRAIAELQQKAATLEAEIAQRLRAERVLRDYLETATIGMHWVGPDGIVLWANQAELDLLGYTRDEYVGRHIADFHADRAAIDDMLARLASGETLREFPARVCRKDGSLRDVLIDSSVLWEDGRFVHTRCFTRDVTEVRRLERERTTLLERERAARAAAERAAERDRRLQEITSQLSRSLEPAEVLTSIARSAADLLDAPVGAVFLLDLDAPDSPFALGAAHGIDAARMPELRLPRHASLAGRAVDEGRTLVVDDVREADGTATALPALLTGETAGSEIAAPIIAGDSRLGVVKAFSPTVRRFNPEDVALLDTLAAAAALTNARLYREAQEAIRSRDEFLASAAHDLKNPLATIKGTAQLLNRQIAKAGHADVPQLTKGLASVVTSATRLAGQIDQLLDITRLRAGLPLELRRQSVDLVSLAHRAVAEHQRPGAAHGIRVQTDLSELRGRWDRARLERILDNLIGNALKYSPDGGDVVVTFARRRNDDDSEVAEVAVRDHGIGIPTADLPHVFERFRRGSNVPETIGGTGIGLASVRQIAEQHGGTVTVESVQGAGSTFTVRLPFDEPRAEPTAEPEVTPALG